ncbi:nuclear transcription factor Y subunit gamma-like isoform X2 [Nematostella vectensis]|uniref:nuclear transcription factor Y subunit gamma-like isoform X1 n=1 Tax=Nematostella vectensis TaxID=45351 RepID=UPI00207720BD|nr:nuclear transcription factor Y subunit gamma-like isoform X1 [Nematostella vectensis]XP_048582272.1 nuclear transcription factor Y subunit gamma-like isoform X1 [Nematostella vectensis]XP_048582273.1 nuclear transcription factor Y subunit gamma-like isoform X2 [Nematostella vectensis]
MMGDVYAQSPSNSEAAQLLATFWPRQMQDIRNMSTNDFKIQELPLARIKKIMKQDEEVKMISAEAPVLFAKAAQIFINELSLRAWIHTEDNKRRTLQRNDIAMAITKFDQFDFLIDIVPRDELKPPKRQDAIRQTVVAPEQVQYYFQLAQHHAVSMQQQQGQQQIPGQVPQQQQVAAAAAAAATTTSQPQAIITSMPQQVVSMATTQAQMIQQPQAQEQGGTDPQYATQIQFNSAQMQYLRLQQLQLQQQQQQQQSTQVTTQQGDQTQQQPAQQTQAAQQPTEFTFTSGGQIYQIQQHPHSGVTTAVAIATAPQQQQQQQPQQQQFIQQQQQQNQDQTTLATTEQQAQQQQPQ